MGIGYRFAKRVLDVVLSAVATLIFIIPWVIIGFIIKIQSPGPAIFKATRVGRDGRTFTLYKFRSMRVDSGPIHTTTLRGDPRIFPFGNFLRLSKIDETPQLINILRGEMSIIGPRPEDEINATRMYIGRYKEILEAVPGLSSPASLYDYAVGEQYEDETKYEEEFLPKKLAVELYYVKHRNLAYDCTLVFRTIITIAAVLLKRKVPIPWEVEKSISE
jgi:lipopolysaccharide/colanic/teichoic acid biosynthesis glycosyltransferase